MRLLLFVLAVFVAPFSTGKLLAETERPNILWITSEDNGQELGCYGDQYADTPNIDRLAARSLRYLNAWSTAPVCAPARTTIISGLYPPSTGAEHMRSMTRLPSGFRMYPQYLRAAGYYCTNNSKEDYNLEKVGQVWDESSRKAHWRKRGDGQPFFAIFNFTSSHESKIRTRPHTPIHDAAKAPIPSYHPDTPEVRRDWAQYYDVVTVMDAQVGGVLKQLEEDGLTDSTIIFYYGDHGSGMPRSKRWPYNSGLEVPMIVHIPEKFRDLATNDYAPGGETKRLVGFIDLAPTVLSLAGIKPPKQMQGHAFLGEFAAPPQPYLYGFRGRMDERYDLVRTVRDQQFIYIRNYMPHKIYGQHIDYMFQTPTTRVWREMYDRGELKPPQTYFWETKPAEELYDLVNDPDEVMNLASSSKHRKKLAELRAAQRKLALKIRDVGFLPEGEIHSRSKGSTPYEVGHDRAKYPLERILSTAELASSLKPGVDKKLIAALHDSDSAVRYWGAMGLLMRGEKSVRSTRAELRNALQDDSPSVRIIAAQALGQYGAKADAEQAIGVLVQLAPLDSNGVFTSMLALNALEACGARAKIVYEEISKLPTTSPDVPRRMKSYVLRLKEQILDDLK